MVLGLEVLGTGILVVTILSFLFLMFVVSRYRKFKTNEFVIYLRNGKVRRAGVGGRVFLMPLIDEVLIIPTTIQQTPLEAREKVVSREYQNIGVTGFVFWQVTNPSEALSDGEQSLKPENFKALMKELRPVALAVRRTI